MSYDNELIANKLMQWEKYLRKYRLPEWDEIPDFGLYMEQVIALLKSYLDYLPPELKDEQFITASTINNYVRKKIMPEPEKKKYYRIHIGYLIIICTLKQCLSIPTFQTMLPCDLSEEEFKKLYKSYVCRHRGAARYFIGQVKLIASGIMGGEVKNYMSTSSTEELISTSAIVSGFSRLLAEKLLLLDGKTMEGEQEDEAGNSDNTKKSDNTKASKEKSAKDKDGKGKEEEAKSE